MRSQSLPILCLVISIPFLVVGCSSNNKGKIEGTKWASKAGKVEDEKVKAGQLILEFGEEGALRAIAFDAIVLGKYSLGAGDKVTMEFSDEVMGEKSHRARISIDGDTLTFSDSSGSLEFTRKK